MSFKLTREHLYWWPVKISVPNPDRPGKWLEQEFEARFVLIPRTEADALLEEIRKAPPESVLDPNTELLRRALRDWRGVVDDDGEPEPFSAEAFDQAMQSTWFRHGLTEAWNASLLPGRARAKN